MNTKNCFSKAKKAFGISLNIVRHVQVLLRQEKAIFPNLRKSHSEITGIQDQKSLFRISMVVLLWLVDCFVLIFRLNFQYKNCFLKSGKSFGRGQSIVWHVQVILRQEKPCLSNFQNAYGWWSNVKNQLLKKLFFQTTIELRFWTLKCFISIFWPYYVYKKCCVESKRALDTI